MSNEIAKSDTLITERGASRDAKAQSGCCGGAAAPGADACCALDADIKATGGSGCGCAPRGVNGARQKKGCC